MAQGKPDMSNLGFMTEKALAGARDAAEPLTLTPDAPLLRSAGSRRQTGVRLSDDALRAVRRLAGRLTAEQQGDRQVGIQDVLETAILEYLRRHGEEV